MLEADPDLERDLDPRDAAEAREQLVAPTQKLPAGQREGPWGPRDPRGHLALMIVEGLLIRRLRIWRSRSAELLGPPDLIRPWDRDGGVALPVTAAVGWEILVPTRVAILDPAFVERAARWPPLGAAFAARGIGRAQSFAIHQAIALHTRVDERLLLLFWHFAGRWGRVTPEGIIVRLQLTHAQLAELAGAQRPSITTALGQLRELGLVLREPDGWLLDPEGMRTATDDITSLSEL